MDRVLALPFCPKVTLSIRCAVSTGVASVGTCYSSGSMRRIREDIRHCTWDGLAGSSK